VADLSGLSQHVIAEVAREFATTRPALAMSGELVAFQSNGPESVRAVQLLNLLVGNLNRPGGIYPDAGAMTGPENSLAELVSFTGKMREGRIRVVLVHGDPVHTVPPATGFQEALAKVPFIVSFSSLLDDTAMQADLILPDHAALESWGDVIPLAGTREAVVGLMQPVVTPLFDTRQFPEVLMAVGRELGGGMSAAFPSLSYVEVLKKSLEKRIGRARNIDFETVWVELLRQGGLFKAENSKNMGYRWVPGASLPNPKKPQFAGDENAFPLHLQVYPSTAFYDGRGAPLPWLQQLPDPMTTAVWGSWVEINPQTATKFGIGSGDLVEVTSPRGSLRLPAVIYPGMRPDMVAIPLGQGHLGMGRYAEGRGVNPLGLIALTPDMTGNQPAWNATRVRLSRISNKGELVTAGHPQGSYRSELIEI
jgi:anaerobic selenocysteine-containing dehydrogenase